LLLSNPLNLEFSQQQFFGRSNFDQCTAKGKIKLIYPSTRFRHKFFELVSNPLEIVLDSFKILLSDVGAEVAVHLLVLHQSLVAAGPQAPRIAVDDVGNHQLALFGDSELDFHVNKDAVQGGPSTLQNLQNHIYAVQIFLILEKLLQYLEDAERHPLHGVDLGLADGDAVELELGAEDLLEGPLRVVVGVVLEEGLLARWGKAESFRHSRVALQERASGQATSHPLDGHHGAFLGHERDWTTLLLEVGRDSCNSKHFITLYY
jgi:hypothetical protein